jgi:hypothetical protein
MTTLSGNTTCPLSTPSFVPGGLLSDTPGVSTSTGGHSLTNVPKGDIASGWDAFSGDKAVNLCFTVKPESTGPTSSGDVINNFFGDLSGNDKQSSDSSLVPAPSSTPAPQPTPVVYKKAWEAETCSPLSSNNLGGVPTSCIGKSSCDLMYAPYDKAPASEWQAQSLKCAGSSTGVQEPGKLLKDFLCHYPTSNTLGCPSQESGNSGSLIQWTQVKGGESMSTLEKCTSKGAALAPGAYRWTNQVINDNNPALPSSCLWNEAPAPTPSSIPSGSCPSDHYRNDAGACKPSSDCLTEYGYTAGGKSPAGVFVPGSSPSTTGTCNKCGSSTMGGCNGQDKYYDAKTKKCMVINNAITCEQCANNKGAFIEGTADSPPMCVPCGASSENGKLTYFSSKNLGTAVNPEDYGYNSVCFPLESTSSGASAQISGIPYVCPIPSSAEAGDSRPSMVFPTCGGTMIPAGQGSSNAVKFYNAVQRQLAGGYSDISMGPVCGSVSNQGWGSQYSIECKGSASCERGHYMAPGSTSCQQCPASACPAGTARSASTDCPQFGVGECEPCLVSEGKAIMPDGSCQPCGASARVDFGPTIGHSRQAFVMVPKGQGSSNQYGYCLPLPYNNTVNEQGVSGSTPAGCPRAIEVNGQTSALWHLSDNQLEVNPDVANELSDAPAYKLAKQSSSLLGNNGSIGPSQNIAGVSGGNPYTTCTPCPEGKIWNYSSGSKVNGECGPAASGPVACPYNLYEQGSPSTCCTVTYEAVEDAGVPVIPYYKSRMPSGAQQQSSITPAPKHPQSASGFGSSVGQAPAAEGLPSCTASSDSVNDYFVCTKDGEPALDYEVQVVQNNPNSQADITLKCVAKTSVNCPHRQFRNNSGQCVYCPKGMGVKDAVTNSSDTFTEDEACEPCGKNNPWVPAHLTEKPGDGYCAETAPAGTNPCSSTAFNLLGDASSLAPAVGVVETRVLNDQPAYACEFGTTGPSCNGTFFPSTGTNNLGNIDVTCRSQQFPQKSNGWAPAACSGPIYEPTVGSSGIPITANADIGCKDCGGFLVPTTESFTNRNTKPASRSWCDDFNYGPLSTN